MISTINLFFTVQSSYYTVLVINFGGIFKLIWVISPGRYHGVSTILPADTIPSVWAKSTLELAHHTQTRWHKCYTLCHLITLWCGILKKRQAQATDMVNQCCNTLQCKWYSVAMGITWCAKRQLHISCYICWVFCIVWCQRWQKLLHIMFYYTTSPSHITYYFSLWDDNQSSNSDTTF